MSRSDKTYNVLFLCTGNSARSILGEAIVNSAGDSRFRAYSAGSRPAGEVNPYALELLLQLGCDTGELRSKSWDEFSRPDSSTMDLVITVCDSAAQESCPVWPGHPVTANWSIPDPAAAKGTEAEKRLAFADAYRMLDRRIRLLMNLPIASLDKLCVRRKITDIGKLTADHNREGDAR